MHPLTPSQIQQDPDRTMIDVREFPEYAAGHIARAQLHPLSRLPKVASAWSRHSPVLLVCRSGKRAAMAAAQLEGLGFSDVAVLAGGMEAWQAAGLPVEQETRRPWSLERQVRVAAGSMIVASSLLALTVSSWFLGWTLFVGLGLVFAGVTDLCAMASVLGKMPWNRAGQPGACSADRT